MVKRFFGKREKSQLGYFEQVKTAQKQEKPVTATPASTLRPDLIPSSNIQPAGEGVLPQHTLRSIVGILLGLVILAMILFTVIGPGRPLLEAGLDSLANQVITPTTTSSTTPVTPTRTPIKTTAPVSIRPPNTPTKTSQPSLAIRPTNTPLIQMIASRTPRPYTPTATIPDCREATSITLADVGQILCVQGTVLKTITNPGEFMVLFSFEHGSFYWVTYDLVWKQGLLNTCYQLRGEILRLGNNPVMVFDYRKIPEVCP